MRHKSRKPGPSEFQTRNLHEVIFDTEDRLTSERKRKDWLSAAIAVFEELPPGKQDDAIRAILSRQAAYAAAHAAKAAYKVRRDSGHQTKGVAG